MTRIENRAVLVTGVSRGLGEAVAGLLLDRGLTVFGLSRQSGAGVPRLREAYPGRFFFREFDLGTEGEKIDGLFKDWIPRDLCLTGLVNNAAMAYDDLLSNASAAQLRKMFEVNVIATILLSKAAVRRMLLQGQGGSIVHVSSVAASAGFKGLSMYGASKAALEGFSAGLAREWGEKAIRSNCVAPGFLDTEMSASIDPEMRSKIHRRTSLRRAATLEEVARSIVFLLSEEASGITGTVQRVGG